MDGLGTFFIVLLADIILNVVFCVSISNQYSGRNVKKFMFALTGLLSSILWFEIAKYEVFEIERRYESDLVLNGFIQCVSLISGVWNLGSLLIMVFEKLGVLKLQNAENEAATTNQESGTKQTKIVNSEAYCDQCGSYRITGQRFCVQCGRKYTNPAVQNGANTKNEDEYIPAWMRVEMKQDSERR